MLESLARIGLVTIDPTLRVYCPDAPPGPGHDLAGYAALDHRTDHRRRRSALTQAWPQHEPDPLVALALRGCAASLHRAAVDLLWAPEAHPVLFRAGQALTTPGHRPAIATGR